MLKQSNWTDAQNATLEDLYSRQGVAFLSQSEIAAEMNSRFHELKLTTNAIVGKVHRLHLHKKYPRGTVTAHHIGHHQKGKKIGRRLYVRKLNDHFIEDRMAAPPASKPVKIRAHTVDPARHCSMEQAMEQGTCLWPVDGGQVCGCDRDKSGPLARPSSYCITHRKAGRQEVRSRVHSDVYISTRQKLSGMRFR